MPSPTTTKSQSPDKLQDFLNLSPLTSKELLTGHFRELAKIYHPDRGGSVEEFQKLYRYYQELLHRSPDNSQLSTGRTAEGHLLPDLGKGLGPTTNGATCTKCSGEGYKTVTLLREKIREEHTCTCRITKCKYCDSGKFTLKSGRIVDCRYCEGSGTFTLKFSPHHVGRYCLLCFGMGFTRITRIPVSHFVFCSPCKGTGETRIINPVLQKGALWLTT